MSASYIDPVDGRSYPLHEPRWRSDAGRPLMVSALPGMGRDDIERGERSIWRYRAALPMPIAPVSLGEGCTPLVEKEWEGACLLYTSPSPRDRQKSRMPSSA